MKNLTMALIELTKFALEILNSLFHIAFVDNI